MSCVNRYSLGARKDRRRTGTLMVGRRAATQIRRAFLHRNRLGGRRGRERSSAGGIYGSQKRGKAAADGCRAVRRNGGAAT